MNLSKPGLFLVVILTIFIFPGCAAGGNNPVLPPSDNLQTSDGIDRGSDRALWGIWEVTFDAESGEPRVLPARELLAHFNINQKMLFPPECEGCFQFTFHFDYVPEYILFANVTLKNTTQLTAYDVRGIVYTNNQGMMLQNIDGWTELYDIPGGESINPFRTFAKNEPQREFTPSAQHEEHFEILDPSPFNVFRFAVDASWPGNCEEPYLMEGFEQEKLYSDIGASAEVRVDVFDWQDDVSKVEISAPEITGDVPTELTLVSNETWAGDVVNSMGAQPGFYEARISAQSAGSGEIESVNVVTVYVSGDGFPLYPTDITPHDLNFTPKQIATKDGYAYVAAGINGFKIYRMSGPSFWEYVTGFDYLGGMPESERDIELVTLHENKAYVAGVNYGLIIYDISDPESVLEIAHLDVPDVPYWIQQIEIWNGYIVFASWSRLYVFDIDTLESTSEISTTLDSVMFDIDGENGMIYSLHSEYDGEKFLLVLEVTPDGILHFLGFVQVAHESRIVEHNAGYVYVMDDIGNLQIVDVDPPAQSHIVETLILPSEFVAMVVNGELLYATNPASELMVYDVQYPLLPVHLTSVELPHIGSDLYIENDLLTVNLSGGGVATLDITFPDAPVLQKEAYSPHNCSMVASEGGYAYVSSTGGLLVIDCDPPETAYVLSRSTGPEMHRFMLKGGYLFGIDDEDFYVYDISDPAAVDLVNVIELQGAYDITVVGDYAFVTPYTSTDVKYIDVSDPESAYVAGSIPGTSHANSIRSDGELIYVVFDTSPIDRMEMYDVVPIEEIHLVGTANISGGALPIGLAVNGEYAVLSIRSAWSKCIAIFDIDPLASAHVARVKFFSANPNYGYFGYPALKGEYAYMPTGIRGLEIYDIHPPEDLFRISEINLPGSSDSIFLDDNIAHIAAAKAGLRIIELW